MDVKPVSVRTPQEFQQVVNEGAEHIIIQEHLDLTGLGPAVNSSDAKEILIHKLSTESIRVRASFLLLLRPLRQASSLPLSMVPLMKLPVHMANGSQAHQGSEFWILRGPWRQWTMWLMVDGYDCCDYSTEQLCQFSGPTLVRMTMHQLQTDL